MYHLILLIFQIIIEEDVSMTIKQFESSRSGESRKLATLDSKIAPWYPSLVGEWYILVKQVSSYFIFDSETYYIIGVRVEL